MRVIAGRFRGRVLTPPEGRGTRPITDAAKETVFNILGHKCSTPGELPPVEVLDLFCGTGSLGIEALSRGAAGCCFVERDRRAVRGLRDNLQRLGVLGVSRVIMENAWTMRPPRSPAGFGLVFVDPPYADSAPALPAVDLLDRLTPVVAPAGLVVYRLEVRTEFTADALRGLRCLDERGIGRMRLLFLSPMATGEPRPPSEASGLGLVADDPPGG